MGAAEMYLTDLHQGALSEFVRKLWMGHEMGPYPQAFSSLVGGWWWAMDGGLPSRTSVRAVCLVSLITTALVVARIATRFVSAHSARSASLIALATVLILPLANGLTRHFMLEGMLMAMVALAVLAALRWTERPTVGRAAWLGVVAGVGLLTKQTFVLVALTPLAFLTLGHFKRHRASATVALLATLFVAGPWWFSRLSEQVSYASASAAGHGSGGPLDHIIYYPTILAKLGLGPPLFALSLWAAGRLLRNATPQTRRGLLLVGCWLVGGLIILTLIPKKYPRLLAPLTPSIAILLAMLWTQSQRERRTVGLGLLLGTVWIIAASTGHTPPLERNAAIDPGCPQQWLRAPSSNDLGLGSVAAILAEAPPGGVSISQDIEIPCDVQTTRSWSTHLGPYLRRSGRERDVSVSAEPAGRFIIRVTEMEDGLNIEGTGKYLNIRDRLEP